jgi:hypothetical protein
MSPGVSALEVYQELAEIYEQQGQAQMRDRFLLLAADAAQATGQGELAERYRQRFLSANPDHMIQAYSSFGRALHAPDVQLYLSNLRLNYPPEVAVELLRSLRSQGFSAPVTPRASTYSLAEDETLHLEEPPAPPRKPMSNPRPGASRQSTGSDQPSSWPPVGPDETVAFPPSVPRKAAPAARAAPAPIPVAPPSPRPAPIPVLPEPDPPPPPTPAARRSQSRQPSRNEDEPASSSGWLATLLFLVVIGGALALVGFTLVRPFLP